VGIFFLMAGFRHLGKGRVAAVEELSSRLGSLAKGGVVVFGTVEIVVALLLIVGLFTQIAALLGIVIALKMLWFGETYPRFIHHEKATYLLLLVILLSLLVTGAGAFAIDLPL